MEVVALAALERGVKMRGYVSCVVGCPYQGPISPQNVLPVRDSTALSGFLLDGTFTALAAFMGLEIHT